MATPIVIGMSNFSKQLEKWQSGRPEASGAVVLKRLTLFFYLLTGEMAERSNAAVLKTVEGHTSGGSNPSFSAKLGFK